MARKTAFPGGFSVTIGDSGTVRVGRLCDDAMGPLREIAASENLAAAPEWDALRLGKRIVDDLGDGNRAEVGAYTVVRDAESGMRVYRVCDNTKEALRALSAEVGFSFDSGWTTRQFGSKLVNFLNGAQPPTAKGGNTAFPDPYVPSAQELEKYHGQWSGLADYVAQEHALDWLFIGNTETAANTDLRIVMVKCSTLNDFYSTNIYKVYSVAENIVSISDFDSRLRLGDPSLVKAIAEVGGRSNYSFATKYCSHHQPTLFPIFDSYVADVLDALRKQNPGKLPFSGRGELLDFATFRSVIDAIRAVFGLEKYSYKDIDRYLWLLGKEYLKKFKKN